MKHMQSIRRRFNLIAAALAAAALTTFATHAAAADDYLAKAQKVVAAAVQPSPPWDGPTMGPTAQPDKTIVYVASDLRNGSAIAAAVRQTASFAASHATCVPGAACGKPMPRSIELKRWRSFRRRTSSVFQVIAIEIEWVPAVLTQCGH